MKQNLRRNIKKKDFFFSFFFFVNFLTRTKSINGQEGKEGEGYIQDRCFFFFFFFLWQIGLRIHKLNSARATENPRVHKCYHFLPLLYIFSVCCRQKIREKYVLTQPDCHVDLGFYFTQVDEKNVMEAKLQKLAEQLRASKEDKRKVEDDHVSFLIDGPEALSLSLSLSLYWIPVI